MRLGVVLPTFADTSEEALEAVRACEDGGIHGAFVYDHLWPMRQPGRPAIAPFPLLGVLAAATERIVLGTLVARVGLVDNEVLVRKLETAHRVSGGRFIAGVGTGDHKSADELRAYGLTVSSAAARRADLRTVVRALRVRGVETWIGGGSPLTDAIARSLSVPLNLWAATDDTIARAAKAGPVSWGGAFGMRGDPAAHLRALQAAGANWAIFAWPGTIAPLVDAAHAAGLSLAVG